MEYEKARELIKDGDFIFVKTSHNIISKTICKITKSQFSHCGIAFWMHNDSIKYDQLFIIEQFMFGRRIVRLSTYKGRGFTVVKTPLDWNLFAKDILDGAGLVSYSFLDFFTIFLKEVFNISIINFKGQVCSEMLAYVVKKYSDIKINSVSMSPGKLFKLLQVNNCSSDISI